jgi:iron complex outermembrane receptor protein
MNATKTASSLTAFLLASTAGWAQSAPPGAVPKEAIEEVVVTAQLRAQKIQRVPISINAFSAAFLKQTGAQTMADLQKYTPGLSVDDTSSTQPTYSIRGLGRDDFGVGTDPTVGLYIDGFYAARSGESLIFFDDIARVEILKGPQGTLFGRNTAAGAISITTNKPSDKYEGMIDEKVGNYGKTETNIMLNVPVTDTFSIRADGIINRRAGYLTNDYNGNKINDEHNEDARVAARWTPSADTDVLLAWDHDNTNTSPPTALGFSAYAQNNGNPYGPIHDHVINGQESRRFDDLLLTIRHDFDGFTLTSLSGYKFFSTQNRESETGSDIPARYFDTENVENNHNEYQEIRANGVWDNLTWVGGVSYYNERAKQQSVADALTDSIDTLLEGQGYPAVFQDFGLLGHQWREQMNNIGQYSAASAFGDATYAVTPVLNITAGLRFTDDQKKFSWQSPPVDVIGVSPADETLIRTLIGNLIFPYPGAGANQLPQGTLVTRANHWTNFSPRVVVDYHWLPDVMTYASITWGYKAGGFESTAIDSEFKPETMQNYEIGLKSDWLQHRLRFNLAAYDYVYRDFQAIALAPVQNSFIPEYQTQTGNLQGRGADLEVIAVPVENLTLSNTTGYINSIWLKRDYDGLGVAPGTVLPGQVSSSNAAAPIYSLAGQPTGEPSLRTVFTAEYLYDLSRFGNIRLHADESITSAERKNSGSTNTEDALQYVAAQEGNPPYIFAKLPGYFKSRELTDARVTWSDITGHYQVALWGTNLFNHRYVTDINTITASTLGTPYVRPQAPRFYGAELTYKF